ncbi:MULTISPECIES: substrate-binding domain-containing protein [unclassified Microcoleus]|uniref:substrate-binding domain-containing protein n=1 Tax=unclassified Microcoleus TaxID=2642155 RepID=UPI002FD3E82D
MNATKKRNSLLTSLGIILASLGLTYAPLPGFKNKIVIVSGTELQEIMPELVAKFKQENSAIDLELKFQGSQEMADKFLDNKNDFKPTVLIPANGEIVKELSSRWRTQNNNSEPFYDVPKPVAKTILVGIAWPERGKVLFPNGRFEWSRIEQAMLAGSWEKIRGPKSWGSFDFVMTDPTRSNSGQLTLSLWAESKQGGNLNSTNLNSQSVISLFSLAKRSVNQPPRSTDILLQEFIARGSNDADAATVYESIALHRWKQSNTTQGKPYQVYYLNPTIETVSTAAIVRRDVDGSKAQAARKFLNFLTEKPQQEIFVKYGFRPIINSLDLKSVPESPWSQNIPGAEVNPAGGLEVTPDSKILEEVKRLWERAS